MSRPKQTTLYSHDREHYYSQVGIRFADNDFFMSVRAFLELLCREPISRNLTRDDIRRAYKLAIFGCYIAAQARHPLEDDTRLAKTRKYLEDGADTVLIVFDEEVTQVVENDFCNGDLSIADFEYANPNGPGPYVFTC